MVYTHMATVGVKWSVAPIRLFVRLSVPCFRFSPNSKGVETSNLLYSGNTALKGSIYTGANFEV